MGILITSKREGFRRAGVEHSSTPTLHADDRFTKEQLAALKAEPMLIVHCVNDEPEGIKPENDKKPDAEETKTPKGKAAAAAKEDAPTGDA